VFVCILPEKAIPEMTYTVSGGTLSPTHGPSVWCVNTVNAAYPGYVTLVNRSAEQKPRDSFSKYVPMLLLLLIPVVV